MFYFTNEDSMTFGFFLIPQLVTLASRLQEATLLVCKEGKDTPPQPTHNKILV